MNAEEGSRTIEILLVEDDPSDVSLTEEAFREIQAAVQLHVAEDGEEALAFLRRTGRFAGAPRPDLILLDLNLPKKDGREVLADIKTDPHLMRIPVVILTTSKAEEDILRSYNLHANAYLTKPVDPEQFVETVRAMESFWFLRAKLPPK